MYRSPGRCVPSRRDTAAPSAQLLTLRPGSDFWTLGHKLFGTTPETYPVAFLAGDILDGAFLAPADTSYAATPTALATASASNLSDMTCLSALHARVSVITICNVFHLFDTAAAQLRLARALAGLLSPSPGSMIVGTQAARPEHGARRERRPGATDTDTDTGTITVFYHSPRSWEALWDGEVFRKGSVEVEARLIEHRVRNGVLGEVTYWFMDWSVTRLG